MAAAPVAGAGGRGGGRARNMHRPRAQARLLAAVWVVGLAATAAAATAGKTEVPARILSNSLSPLQGLQGLWPGVGVLSPVTPSWLSGSWGPWSAWSGCSRTCGTGVAVQTRECRRRTRSRARTPDKQDQRKKHRKRSDRSKKEGVMKRKKERVISTQCVGQYKRVHVCNEQSCPNGNRDFRTLQCEAYNRQNFSGHFYQWEPFLSAPDPCQLNCRAKGFRFYATLNQTVVDGTSCSPRPQAAAAADRGLRWLCVTGICQRVGCDGVVGSSARTDACGVCGGDNSTCRAVSGIFTRPQLPPGLNVIALLPQGACNLSIAQLRPTRNLLSLRLVGGSPVLNSGRGASWPGVYEAGGTRFTYGQADGLRAVGESLSAPGPLTEPLELLLLYQQPNPGIKYEYALPVARRELSAAGAPPTALASPLGRAATTTASPRDAADNEVADDGHRYPFDQDVPAMDSPALQRGKGRKYVWRVTGLSECSKTCGGGTQQSVIHCVRENSLLPVSEKRCQGLEKPPSFPVRCGTRPCPAQWVTGDWSGCSVTCGTGTQTRENTCRQEISSTLTVHVDHGACLGARPEIDLVQPCRLAPCSGHHHHHHHHGHHHVAHPRPPPPPQRDLRVDPEVSVVSTATTTPVPEARWSAGPWSQCSSECGRGLRTRAVSCPAGGVCPAAEQPPAQEPCDAGPCATAGPGPASAHFWLASDWSSHCSAECGTGVQSRSVACSAGPGAAAAACEPRLRPAHTRACSAEPPGGASCRGQWFSAPWGPCSTSCGQGVQSRGVACVQWQRGQGRYQVQDDEYCDARQRPEQQQPCAERTCPPHWYAGEWSECSRSCGTGAQKREVRCIGPAGPSTACSEDSKLPTRKPCQVQECVVTRALSPSASGPSYVTNESDTQDEPADAGVLCEDRLRNCHLVVQARLCKYSYYGTSCCHSCRRKGE